jgi:hypothetical protein
MESNCLLIPKAIFDEIGGYNESYKHAGGGLVNHDFYARAVAAAAHVFTLLGEGTFHQVHGGAATGLTRAELDKALKAWWEESRTLRGDLRPPGREKFILAGHMPPEARRWLQAGLSEPAPGHQPT